jgi:hypothetical protein
MAWKVSSLVSKLPEIQRYNYNTYRHIFSVMQEPNVGQSSLILDVSRWNKLSLLVGLL